MRSGYNLAMGVYGMGFRKYNRKSVFVTLFLSFVLILFFPLIIESGLYYRMESIIKNNANRSNVAMLNQVSQVVDNRLEEVHKLAMQVSFNPKLQWLLRRSESLGRQDAYRYVNLMDDLKNYKILNGFIHDFYVYIPRQDVVVTPFAKSDAEMFYRYYYRYENMTYTEWQDALLQSDHVMSYLPSKIVQQGISLRTEDVISYIQPLPFGEAAQAKGSLVILINEQQIKNLLKNIEWVNRGDIYILDQHDQPIMTTANKPVSLSGIHSKITQSSGIFEHGVDDQEGSP